MNKLVISDVTHAATVQNGHCGSAVTAAAVRAHTAAELIELPTAPVELGVCVSLPEAAHRPAGEVIILLDN